MVNPGTPVKRRMRISIVLLLFLLEACSGLLFAQNHPQSGPPWNSQELIAMALSNESNLAALREDGRAASARVQGAKAERWPKVGIETSSSYLSDPILSVPAGSLGTLPPPFPPGTRLPAENTDVFGQANDFRYDINLWLEQPLITWGKISAGIDAARYGETQARLSVLSRETQLRSGIITITESLSLLEQMLKLAAQQQGLGERLSELTQANFQAGFLLETEYRDMRDRLQKNTISQSALKDESRRLLLNLTEITGKQDIEIQFLRLPDVDFTFKSYQLPEPEVLIARAWKENPELKMLGVAEDVAAARLILAGSETAGKPDLAFRTEFAYGGGFGRTVDELDGSWTLSLGARATIFDAGRSKSITSEARYSLEAARARREAGRRTMENAIRAALNRMELSRENIEYYDSLAITDQQRSDVKKAAWDEGYGREEEWLLAELDRLSTEILRLQETAIYLQEDRQLRRLTNTPH